jgi:hypothetical protein
MISEFLDCLNYPKTKEILAYENTIKANKPLLLENASNREAIT